MRLAHSYGCTPIQFERELNEAIVRPVGHHPLSLQLLHLVDFDFVRVVEREVDSVNFSYSSAAAVVRLCATLHQVVGLGASHSIAMLTILEEDRLSHLNLPQRLATIMT